VRAVIKKNKQITKGARGVLEKALQLSASFSTHMGQNAAIGDELTANYSSP
jgi:hypothetical protein